MNKLNEICLLHYVHLVFSYPFDILILYGPFGRSRITCNTVDTRYLDTPDMSTYL